MAKNLWPSHLEVLPAPRPHTSARVIRTPASPVGMMGLLGAVCENQPPAGSDRSGLEWGDENLPFMG